MSTPELRIEPAGLAHCAVLVELYRRCFETPWTADAMAAVLASPGAFATLAVPDRIAPVGFALARHAGDELEVISLGVVPPHRRQGAAALLLRDLMRRAGLAGSTRVVLEVAETNEAARALYAGHGFWAVGRRPDYYQAPNRVPVAALTMAWEVVPSPSGPSWAKEKPAINQ